MRTTKAAIDLEMAHIILTGLRRAGYTCGIVGGYARDSFFGIPPKDLDICVAVGSEPAVQGVEYTLDQVNNALVQEFYREKMTPEMNVAGMYNDHASDRGCGVFQFPDHGIDVILYRDCANMQDIMNSFDYNLNQFIFDEDERVSAYAGSTSLLFDGLTPVREDFNQERAVKMMRKYQDMLPLIKAMTHEGYLV